MGTTDLEKQNLEAHVDLCEQRYKNLESRLSNIEEKVESIRTDINAGNKSMVKVIIGATGTIVAGSYPNSSPIIKVSRLIIIPPFTAK